MVLLAQLTGRGGKRSERTERVLLVVAVVVFVSLAVVAWRELPPLERPLDPRFGLVVVLLGAAALGINALEFAWSARVLGSPVGRREALRVSTLSSAANFLPIPGSIAIRTRALLQGGQTLGTAATVTTAVGVAWVGAAAVAAALLAVVINEPQLAWAAFGGGTVAILLAVLVLRRAAREVTGRDFAELALIEVVSVVASGTRLFAVALTIGLDVSFGQALAVNLGGILSHIAGFLPGGLGLRELASGAFGALVGMPVSVGVVIAVADRLVFYVVLAGVALAMVRGGPGEIKRLAESDELGDTSPTNGADGVVADESTTSEGPVS